jgi:hypothetical protein
MESNLGRAVVLTVLLGGAAGCVTVKTSQGGSAEYVAPVTWGAVSGSNSCVIFKEYRKTQVGFFVVALTTKTHGELEVVESGSYQLPKPIWLQSQEDMDELQRLAVRDRLRFVKVRDKHTPKELIEAREICAREDASGVG